jgi:hypothetical protein
MALFSSLFGKTKQQAVPNPIRETLFGDMPLEQWLANSSGIEVFPWNAFVLARAHLAAGRQQSAIDSWEEILRQPNLEPRQYLQAWHFLRQHGTRPPPEVAKQVLGVVIEVAMPAGLDLLAAYADHSARYYNYSGAGVVWEHPDTSLDSDIDQLLVASKLLVDKIGPWEQPRPTPPTGNQARLCFLTPSGLHFSQAPMAVLSNDPMAGRIVKLATVLMQALLAKANKSNQAS